MNVAFEYEPLDSSRHQIRILSLKAGVGKARLECDIDSITLADESFAEEYEALSYCWGDPTSVSSIFVGAAITISSNLCQILHNLRKETAVRKLWIDAICINQADEDEKASHVRRMNRVYRAATNVLIWSDEPPSKVRGWNPAAAFAVVERLYELSVTCP